ncbi:putative bZIP transcription factor [Pyronema omphalodes]|nr:putative bZIP transcription factor [Pyronema omphalodes]
MSAAISSSTNQSAPTQDNMSPKRALVTADVRNPSAPSASVATESPPRTTEAGNNNRNSGDYFSIRHSRLDQEPNPFEQSFAAPNHGDHNSQKATILPPVTAMTSPAISGRYGWGSDSLRSGPLSPAMLQAPQHQNLTFDSHLRTGLTPNESAMRSGLTPGGSGTIFPGQPGFLFHNSNNVNTPTSLEFQKTAQAAAARVKRHSLPQQPGPAILLPQSEMKVDQNLEIKSGPPADSLYNADPAHNAANGLYLLAHMGGTKARVPSGAAQGFFQQNPPMASPPVILPSPEQKRALEQQTSQMKMTSTSPTNDNRRLSQSSMPGAGSENDTPEKKGRANNKRAAPKRKSPPDSSAKKKAKGNDSRAQSILSNHSEQHTDSDGDEDNKGKKTAMTDEEKRKNFLERNRVAALKCRQRKKQWLNSLQAKVEMYGAENDTLTASVHSLREEVVHLKTLLLAHKDCSVTRATGINMEVQANLLSNPMPQPHGYDVNSQMHMGYNVNPMMGIPGVGMHTNQHPNQQNDQRRYS